jgi:hypothetical protein
MRKLLIAITLSMAMLAVGPVVASEETDVMVPVQQFIDGFNKQDLKSTAAACTAECLIIDDFAPHRWSGPGSVLKWMKDYNAFVKKNGISEATVTLGTPAHVDVTGVDAYVVVPTEYAMKKNGEPKKETGIMTLIVNKGEKGWRITAWAWADQ